MHRFCGKSGQQWGGFKLLLLTGIIPAPKYLSFHLYHIRLVQHSKFGLEKPKPCSLNMPEGEFHSNKGKWQKCTPKYAVFSIFPSKFKNQLSTPQRFFKNTILSPYGRFDQYHIGSDTCLFNGTSTFLTMNWLSFYTKEYVYDIFIRF